MKPSILGLLIAAGAFGASSVWLAIQLDEERTRADQVLAESQALHARIAELEGLRAEVDWVREASGGVISAGATGQGVIDEPVRAVSAAPVAEETVAAEIAPGRNAMPPPEPPEAFRKMMRTQFRARTRQLYAGIGARLGLNAEDTSRLIDLLTDQQVAEMEGGRMRRINTGRPDPASNHRQEQLDAVAQLIGYDKIELFKDYQKTLPARQEVAMIARQLEGADQNLSADQQERLVTVLVEERQRVPPPEYIEGTSREAHQEAMAAWQADYSERTGARVRNVLSGSQLTTYNEYQEWMREMRKRIDVRRGMRRDNTMVAEPAVGVALPLPAPAPRR